MLQQPAEAAEEAGAGLRVVRLPLLLALALAGCLSPGAPGDVTDNPAAPAAAGWPDPNEAPLRPGVGLDWARPTVVPGVEVNTTYAGCTVNFVFTSLDNASVYLGTAAHCVEGNEPPYVFRFTNIPGSAQLAYSSWYTIRERKEGSDREASPMRENDFALLRVDNASRHLVHPGLVHLGGPTGLAEGTAVGDGLLTYGRSFVRASLDRFHPRAGCVSYASEWVTRGVFAGTVGPGDSGSPVLMASGEAAGVMIRLGGPLEGSQPAVGSVATNLAPALRYMEETTGLRVRLATWPLQEAPTVVPPACP